MASDGALEQTNSEVKSSFIIVGLGASAGGLKALQQFFDHMPPDSGMAFVIVTHLAPAHVSHLPDLLQSHTTMPVTQVTKTLHMAANHVYVMPPNRYLSAIDTHLRLSKTKGAQRPQAPIDHFFRTLADMHGEQAVGVILSGTGSDGALGIKRIKEWGGLTIAQDPSEAEYGGMPQSAIGTGVIDFVLPVHEIATQLLQYTGSAPGLPLAGDGKPASESAPEIMQKILVLLRGHTGHDFSRYKSSTLTRRIQRRMQIQNVEELTDYLRILRANRAEVEALFKDLLISVTNFFRDQEAFELLEQKVIPRLFAGKTNGNQVRAWVVGCATGEEAYSLAMLLLEYAGRLDHPPEIQIFASDISGDALGRAREGLYPEAIAADVSPERLKRFFHKEPDGYRVKQEVRECILFAPHNVLKDPPFARLDLVSCRNLLIYFRRDAQRKIFELFHYALRPEGYLFLGSAEAIEGMELFRAVSKKQSVFQSNPSIETHLLALPLAPLPQSATLEGRPERKEVATSATIHRRMLEQYGPPSILVNADYNILHLSELAGRYLRQPGGEPTNNILRRILPPLRSEVTATLYRALKQEEASRSKPIRVVIEGQPWSVRLSVSPAKDADLKGLALIVFDESEAVADIEAQRPTALAGDATIPQLEEELEQTKQRLQTTIEESETSKEEMKAANEELLSMNEELRSTGEELETSKEELQSMNEELVTLNQENKNKVEELSQLTGDLQNFLMATDIATLFLDRELRIRRFTPRLSELFNILLSDRGRPLAHLTHKLGYATLLEDATSVLRSLIPLEREIRSKDGSWYLTRLLPYRTADDRIDGVVITFVVIDELKRAQQEAQKRAQQQAAIVLLGRLALEGEEVDFLFDRATRQVCEVLGVEFCEVLERQSNGETLLLKAGQGWDKSLIGKVIIHLGARSHASYTLQANEPILVEEWSQEKRFKPSPYVAEQDIVSSASIVIPGFQHPYGVLRAHSRQKHSLSGDDASFFQAVANLLGVAIERKQIEAQLQDLNETLEERVAQRTTQVRNLASELLFTEQRVRQHVAQVLHDDLQQLLFAAQIHIQFVRQGLAPVEQTALLPEIEQAKSMIEEALKLTRHLTIDLSPPVLQGQDLSESLQWLVNYMKELHGLEVELKLAEVPAMTSDNMRLLLFQIVRELLFNAVKHAGVQQAQVHAFAQGGDLLVQVRDEGAGFDPATLWQNQQHDGGYGLRNMSERLGLFSGRLDIVSQPGKGTMVTVIIPKREGEPPMV